MSDHPLSERPSSERPVRVAVDIGGTFTDIQVHDARHRVARAFKTPTTPDDPSEGLITGLRGAADRFGFALGDIGLILHGTTIATNAVLERKLPKAALVTTAGFEDVLEIGRHLRRDIYALKAEHRSLLVPRRLRFGVGERVRADGTVETPLDEAGLAAVADRLRGAEVETVAIAFLHAYANPAHERRAAAILGERLPGVAVSTSAEVSPEIREFERTSTTVLNALLVPVVSNYLGRIEARLADSGITASLYLVQSNGGVAPPVQAGEQPVRLLLSGPAGGTMAVARVAGDLGLDDVVAIDMGGTSSDVSVVEGGRVSVIGEGEIDGLPVRVPMVEMRTIGAGGGSIGRVEPGGGLRVGPESAGAAPGPVAYGRGGERPTVTDANVVLGRLDPDWFLGGALRLDAAAAKEAIRRDVADPLHLDPERAAEGVVAVANAGMAAAIRLSLFEKGADPADFTLVAFGGAGGLHAIHVAEEMDIATVVFPADPATLSAGGMLHADIVHDLARSERLILDIPARPRLAELAADLRERGDRLLDRDEIPPERREFALTADLRYAGQAYELMTPWPEDPGDEASIAALVERFHALHHQRFAHDDRGAAVEMVTLRLAAIGRMAKPESTAAETTGPGEPKGRRRVFIDGRWTDVPVFDRTGLSPGRPIDGAAVVEEEYTTILLPESWHLEANRAGHLIARRTHDGEITHDEETER